MTLTTHLRAYATVNGAAAIYIGPDGHTEPVHPDAGVDIRQAIVRRAADEARRAGTPVELVTGGDRGTHRLLIHTDGTLTAPDPATNAEVEQDAAEGELEAEGAPTTVPLPELDSAEAELELVAEAEVALTPEPRKPDTSERPAASFPERESEPEQPPADAATEDLDRDRNTAVDGSLAEGDVSNPEATAPVSFLTARTRRVRPDRGWRALLARAGVPVGPSVAQVERAGAVGMVSRQWAGCRTIAVVNGKGGVGKTMTTAMLAAVFARHGGGNVLAWDNNDTRGTLGWRTEPGLYDTTIRDLHANADRLLGPDAGVSDIAGFVHHQAGDRYDVLRSNPELLAADQRLSTGDVDLLMRVAARYYRMVIFDSGNDESADRWLRMIDHSTQLVIPTLPSPESAHSAALLLDALRHRDERSATLADHAVVVLTHPEPARARDAQRIADGFAGTVHAVHTIPFDLALKSGPLRYDALRPATRDAWLQVAAAATAHL